MTPRARAPSRHPGQAPAAAASPPRLSRRFRRLCFRLDFAGQALEARQRMGVEGLPALAQHALWSAVGADAAKLRTIAVTQRQPGTGTAFVVPGRLAYPELPIDGRGERLLPAPARDVAEPAGTETTSRKRDLTILATAAPSTSTASISFVLTTRGDRVHRDRNTALLADSLRAPVKTGEMQRMKEPDDERSSEPHQPRVMRRHPQGWGRSVDRGKCRPAIEP